MDTASNDSQSGCEFKECKEFDEDSENEFQDFTLANSAVGLENSSAEAVISNDNEPISSTSNDVLGDNSAWLQQKTHIFIMSKAGKPIFSLHGNENKLADMYSVIFTLVSFVQDGEDAITSIHAKGIKFVFLVAPSLILVAVSRGNCSVQQLQMQLSDVHNQIISILTDSMLTKTFERRLNHDLRKSLAGSERFIYHLLQNDCDNKKVTNNVFTSLTKSIRVMPLSTSVRCNISGALQNTCSKIKNLVFALLIADNKLISLVRMKQYTISPSDLRLILNVVECSESFKTSENWTPLCLPNFNKDSYLHAHVSYLADDCQACLLLLSVDRDAFFTLSDAKSRITEKLRSCKAMDAIREELDRKLLGNKLSLSSIGITELRHFLYKPKNTAQMLCTEIAPPYDRLKEFERLEAIYVKMLQKMYSTPRPLKLMFEITEKEVVLAWVTSAYELYAVFEPFVEKNVLVKHVDKLIKWIEKEHDVFFIRNHPTF